MRMNRLVALALVAIAAIALTPVFLDSTAEATAQWTRKYKVPCQTCHTAFPRLNYYGELFMRNGYQLPGEPSDGNDKGKQKVGSDLVIDNLKNHFGVRLNMTPLEIETNTLQTLEGSETKYKFGNPNWMQVFVAGSIFKNVSIFIEAEFTQHDFHWSWFNFKFTNLAGTLANLQVGQLSAMDLTSYSNRLRMMGTIKGDVFRVKSSLGKGVDSVDLSSAAPGIQYYGYTGAAMWYAGLRPGSKLDDPNNELVYWGGVRFDVPESRESAWEGSNFGVHYMAGTDTLDPAVSNANNQFWRVTPAINIRHGGFDLQTSVTFAHDNNITLAEDGDVEGEYWGVSAVAGFLSGSGKWYPSLQFDYVQPDEDSSVEDLLAQEKVFLSPSISWFPMQNFRLGLYGRFDMHDTDNEYLGSEKKHEIFLNIRTMF